MDVVYLQDKKIIPIQLVQITLECHVEVEGHNLVIFLPG